MGVELHVLLERRVPDKEALQTASTLERAELPLPNDLVEHCGRQLLRGSRMWEVVRYEGWLAADDATFRATSDLFDTVFAAVFDADLWIDALRRAQQDWSDYDEGWAETEDRATVAARAAVGMTTEVKDGFVQQPEAVFNPECALAQCTHDRFALLTSCMREGVPEDSRATPSGDHSFCWCPLDELLATEWSAAQRAAMGEECLRELERLGQRIVDAGLHLGDHRLLFSFSS